MRISLKFNVQEILVYVYVERQNVRRNCEVRRLNRI